MSEECEDVPMTDDTTARVSGAPSTVICDNCKQDGEFARGYGLPNGGMLKFCSAQCRRIYCDDHGLYLVKTDRY